MTGLDPLIPDRMGLRFLWDKDLSGAGVSVAVLDSGITPDSEFSDNVIEDIDFTGEDRPRHKSYWHGTQVCQCIHWVAENANIGNLRVVPSHSALTRDNVIQALDYCISVYPKYRIVNISLSFIPDGCPDNCPLCNKINEAYVKGMMIVVAAGNRGPKPNTITCPALAHWALRNYATLTQSDIDYWKRHWLKRLWEVHITGRFGKDYGTSYSAGYTSGSVALIFSGFPKVDADTVQWSISQIEQQLRSEVGHRTTMKFDRVYKNLEYYRDLASNSKMMITKNGALRPYLRPF